MEFFDDPTIRELKKLEIKLWHLSRISDSEFIKDVAITFKTERSSYSLTSTDLPFDLENEIKVLLADAMDLIKQDINRIYNGIKYKNDGLPENNL